jgi:RNA polymerase sigma-70 factor (ECF subfamily)
MSAATRRTLLARVRDAGDLPAWAEFHGLYAPLLLRYARALGLARDDAEEVRDACLEVLARRMRSFDYRPDRGRFRTWLYRIVRDKVADLLRRRAPRRADTALLARLEDPSSDPDARYEAAWRRQELRRALARALRSVSPRDARAFLLLLRGELGVPEVGGALGINANQVYKAKSRVLARVRAALAAAACGRAESPARPRRSQRTERGTSPT